MPLKFSSLLNILIRGLSLGSKFLLIFALAEFLTPAEVGEYGLISSIIGLGVYIIGLEFYTFSTREIINSAPEKKIELIINQFYLYTPLYILSIPILHHIYLSYNLEIKHFPLVYLLLITEHAALEINRILISLNRALLAGIILFIRMGAWIIILIATQCFIENTRSLPIVLYFWISGSITAILIGTKFIFRNLPNPKSLKIKTKWIKKGIKIIIPLLIASIALRSMSTIDRFMLEAVSGIESVAPYIVYSGICAAIISLIDAGIVDFLYPKLVQLANTNKKKELIKELKRSAALILCSSISLMIIANTLGAYILEIFSKPIYSENFWILQYLSVSTILYASALPAHLFLYATKKDNKIMYSQLIGLLSFVAVFYFLKEQYDLAEKAVLGSVIAGWATTSIAKNYWAFLKKVG